MKEIYSQERIQGPDIIKTVSMFVIVVSHAISYCVLNTEDNYIWRFVANISIVADNLFIIASGYLSARYPTKAYRKQKIFRLIIKSDLYSWIIFLVLIIFGYTKISVENRFDIFPILTGGYWFITCYIGLYLIKPFLDNYLKTIDQRLFKRLIIVLVFVFSIFASIPYSLEIGSYHGYSICWFIALYVLGYYVYISGLKFKKYYFLILVFLLMEKFLIETINVSHSGFVSHCNDVNNIVWLIISVILFLLLKDLRTKSTISQKVIALTAKSTFGVFLIHMQPSLKIIIWKWQNSWFELIVSAAVIFVACVLLDSLIGIIAETVIRIVTKKKL